jgi:hypothetical protein
MQVLTTAPEPLSPQVNATEAATTSGAARTTAVRVAFSVKLDGGGGGGGGSGGGGDDDVSLPPEEVRLHVSLPAGYPHQKVMPRFMLSHHMLRDQVSSLIAC